METRKDDVTAMLPHSPNAFSTIMFGALTLVAGGLTTAFTTVNKIQNDEKRKEEEVTIQLSIYTFPLITLREAGSLPVLHLRWGRL
jgi:hypothetical protein